MEDFDEENEARPPVKLDFSGRANGGNRSRSFGSDRGAKLRLLSLLGLLLLVIVAMKEAGKPERWMWLGFDEPANPEFVADKDISADDIVVQAEEESAGDSGVLTEQQNGQ